MLSTQNFATPANNGKEIFVRYKIIWIRFA